VSEAKPDPEYHVGDRVKFSDVGSDHVGIIRAFRWVDWADEPLAVIDIDPPLRGGMGASMGRQVEQHRIIGRATAT
jgi:hypothetical protein